MISGPSGVGKTTILRMLLERLPELIPSVSATTRPPRAGEREGIDYHFLLPDEFARRRENGEFLECCRVYGRDSWYGTLVDEVAPRLAAGRWVVLEIDVEGTLSVLEHYAEAVTIFVEPSRPEQLDERLTRRGTESPEAIERRLEVARLELEQAYLYRHRVVNENIEEAVGTIVSILRQAGLSVAGDDVAGDDVAGDDVAGDDVAGDDVAGDDVAGDDVAGDGADGGGADMRCEEPRASQGSERAAPASTVSQSPQA